MSSQHMGLSLMSYSSCQICCFVISCCLLYSFCPLGFFPTLYLAINTSVCPCPLVFSLVRFSSPPFLSATSPLFAPICFSLGGTWSIFFSLIASIYICRPIYYFVILPLPLCPFLGVFALLPSGSPFSFLLIYFLFPPQYLYAPICVTLKDKGIESISMITANCSWISILSVLSHSTYIADWVCLCHSTLTTIIVINNIKPSLTMQLLARCTEVRKYMQDLNCPSIFKSCEHSYATWMNSSENQPQSVRYCVLLYNP